MARTKTPALPICDWTLDADYCVYETSCGKAFQVTDGTPAENGMHFCCYCGKRLRERKAEAA